MTTEPLITTRDKELQEQLLNELKRLKETSEYPDLGRAFQHWIARSVLGLADIAIKSELNGSLGRDSGIDYFNINKDARVVEIVQAKFSESFEASIPPSELDAFFQIPDKLHNNVGVGSSFQERCQRYVSVLKQGFGVKLYLAIAGNLSHNNKQVIEYAKSKLPSNTMFDLLETEHLLSLVTNPKSQTCSMQLVSDESFANNGHVEKVVATVSAKELKRLYNFIRPHILFSLNPRNKLPRNKASAGIVATLRSEPNRLWYYNNGVNAICDDFNYDKKYNSLTVWNLKIVNGCQTVTTIAEYADLIDDDATLLVRLSKAIDPEFSHNISKYTNTQNTMKVSDLESRDPLLLALEKKFEHYSGKFFWERQTGSSEYTQDKYPKKLKSLRVISNVAAAQLKMAFALELPHKCISVGQANIFSPNYYVNNGPTLFTAIYDKAKPEDFILPNIFWCSLTSLAKNTDKSTSSGMLLSLKIGKYYIISMIGAILRSFNENDRLVEKIIHSVDSAPDILTQLETHLVPLVEFTTSDLESILSDNTKKLPDYVKEDLKKQLGQEIFPKLYAQRRKYMISQKHEPDLFIRDLEQLFA